MTNGLSNPNNLGKSTFNVGGIGSNFPILFHFLLKFLDTVYNYFIPFCALVYHSRGAVDDPMNCCPKAEGNSSSGHPQHRGGDNLTVAQKDLK